jgi:hypothetical protein
MGRGTRRRQGVAGGGLGLAVSVGRARLRCVVSAAARSSPGGLPSRRCNRSRRVSM